MLPRPTLVIVLLAASTLASCIVVRSVSVDEISPEAAPGRTIDSPLKAFLVSGDIVVYPSGSVINDVEVVGRGTRYGIDLTETGTVERLPLDSIVGLEAFDGSVNAGATFLASIGATAAVLVGGIAIACAVDPKCFGSCPTIYSWEEGQEVLEAEAFSYSIAPLLEGRDVDRLGVRPADDGTIHLELRNEALETHYINHLELLQVDHRPGRTALPDQDGRLITVGRMLPLEAAFDRDGRSLMAELSERDGVASESSRARLESVSAEDYRDAIHLTFPRPAGDEAALVLRLRNSLLNSVLFYDLMLGSSGAAALDWLGRDIQKIGEAVRLGRWFQETMGLTIEVLDEDRWVEVARVPDTGPIAWEEMAVPIPVSETAELHVRLRSLADEWRIDHVQLAEDVREADATVLPLRSIAAVGREANDGFRELLAEPDEDYLVTTAASAFELRFEARENPAGESTFFLSSQGYYTEWVRPEWIRTGASADTFRPTDDTVVELVERWLLVKEDFEERFFATRIPVR